MKRERRSSSPVPAAVSRQMYDELKEGVAHLVRIQRDFCNRLATEARKTLETLGLSRRSAEKRKADQRARSRSKKKRFENSGSSAKELRTTKFSKRLKENPDLRAEIEKWDTYFYRRAATKKRNAQTLSELYIIVDERANEYELTDKGIQRLGRIQRQS